MGNSALTRARVAKRDEFHTQLEDVEKELDHYRSHFEGKVVYLNCDDPEFSAFWKYFSYNFDLFGLKKLMATHYVSGGSSYMSMLEEQYDANDPNIVRKALSGDGDFRSDECIELLKEADIVITNPPFSLFREYMAQLVEYGKKFIIIGNQNAMTYKEIFPLIKDGVIWLGNTTNKTMWFSVPDDYELKEGNYKVESGRYLVKVPAISWYTNLDYTRRHGQLVLTKFYEGNEEAYPMYDNYRAIEVSRVKEIPMDYVGVMGVPITFLNNHNPDQFEVVGSQRWAKSDKLMEVYAGDSIPPENDKKTLIGGKETYDRIFIINKKPITKEELALARFYEGNESKYPTYDNYDAIEVGKVREIPMDYVGVMGVPITFLNNHNPDQFEILGIADRRNSSGLRIKKYTSEDTPRYNDLNVGAVIKLDDGTYKVVYVRVLIRNKKPVSRIEMLGF